MQAPDDDTLWGNLLEACRREGALEALETLETLRACGVSIAVGADGALAYDLTQAFPDPEERAEVEAGLLEPLKPNLARMAAGAGGATEAPARTGLPAPDVRLCRTEEDVRHAAEEIAALGSVGVDVETRKAGEDHGPYRAGLDPYLSKIRLLQVGNAERQWVFDADQAPIEILFPLLGDRAQRHVLHNAKFDLGHLMLTGAIVRGVYDTMLMDLLLSNGFKRSLEALANGYLGLELDKTLQTSDWGGDLSEDQLRYAARDVQVLVPLAEHLDGLIRQARMEQVAGIENRAVAAFARLQLDGIGFDRAGWDAITEETARELAQVAEELRRTLPPPRGVRQAVLFGVDTESMCNLDSPKDVRDSLAHLGIDLPSTDDSLLQPLKGRHEVVRLLLEYRHLAKLMSSYLTPIPGYLHPVTGRIHAEYEQIGAASGRTASRNPNIQQVPREKRFRDRFVAAEGNVLVIADYSQIELRIMAELTRDPRMLDAYRTGTDLHRLTASLVTGKSLEAVSKDERQLAKAVNFGLVYGMSPRGLVSYAQQSYGVAMSLADADLFVKRYFNAYPSIRRWQQDQIARSELEGETRTLAGRRWRVPPGKAGTRSLNYPDQGTGADILKAALGTLVETAWETGWRMVAQVHDETVLEVPAQDTEAASVIQVDTMVEAAKTLLATVPVEAEGGWGTSWASK